MNAIDGLYMAEELMERAGLSVDDLLEELIIKMTPSDVKTYLGGIAADYEVELD